MIENNVACLGLTRMQFHKLCCHFPIAFRFYQGSARLTIKKMLKLYSARLGVYSSIRKTHVRSTAPDRYHTQIRHTAYLRRCPAVYRPIYSRAGRKRLYRKGEMNQ